MQERIGNLLDEVTSGVILQVVNAQGAMNSGFAKQVRQKWPKVYSVYSDAIQPNLPDRGASWLGTVIPVGVQNGLFVANLVAQQFYGSDGKRYLSYDALDTALKKVAELNALDKLEIHHPMIGCGLAGGSWDVVQQLIKQHLGNTNLWKICHK